MLPRVMIKYVVAPSFNTLLRAALYSSDYFLVPCTPGVLRQHKLLQSQLKVIQLD